VQQDDEEFGNVSPEIMKPDDDGAPPSLSDLPAFRSSSAPSAGLASATTPFTENRPCTMTNVSAPIMNRKAI